MKICFEQVFKLRKKVLNEFTINVHVQVMLITLGFRDLVVRWQKEKKHKRMYALCPVTKSWDQFVESLDTSKFCIPLSPVVGMGKYDSKFDSDLEDPTGE